MADIHVALKDGNSVASAIFESSTNAGVILRGKIDENTGRVLVDTVSSAGTFVTNEIVSGSNTTFTLANSPILASQAVYGAGIRLTPGAGNDYTISGAVITILSPATYSAGQVLADYRY